MDVSLQRLQNQHLIGKPFSTVAEAVGWLGAVQAQDYPAAKWGLAQRLSNLSEPELDTAFDNGTILRTHILRPTWHFVLPRDIRWMLAVTAPKIYSASAYYYRKCELSPELIAKTNDWIAKAVEGSQYKTRDELADMLRGKGLEFDTLRLTYIVMCAEIDAVICSGPRRGKQFTYGLLDERAPASLNLHREEALAELATRYYQSHGPASLYDFGNWASFNVAEAKYATSLIERSLETVDVGGKPFYFLPCATTKKPKDPIYHLLPNYDEHLIAYKDYAPSFDPEVYKAVGSNEMFLHAHIVTRNGKVIGGWRRTLSKKKTNITIMPIVVLSELDRSGIEAATQQYGAFLGLEAEVEYQATSS